MVVSAVADGGDTGSPSNAVLRLGVSGGPLINGAPSIGLEPTASTNSPGNTCPGTGTGWEACLTATSGPLGKLSATVYVPMADALRVTGVDVHLSLQLQGVATDTISFGSAAYSARLNNITLPAGYKWSSQSGKLLTKFPSRDLNGDRQSDVFWLNTATTQTYVWQMNGSAISGSGSPASTGDAHWQVAGIGDFDGDGRADVLFRHQGAGGSGTTVVWLMNGLTIASSGSPGTVADLGWQVQGVGDFDGDGKADVLWMHTDGTVQIWIMNGTSHTSTPTVISLGAASGWTVQGIGDFDGDGKSDILWRHANGTVLVWLMNGAVIASSGSPANVGPSTPTSWQVLGVGDFDGDGKADILWRNDDLGGIIYVWTMNGATISSAAAVTGVGTAASEGWLVKSIGDYNGDGKADVFWKNDILPGNEGITYVWLMDGPTISSYNSVTGVPDTNWQVQSPK